jgi:hypothetical protein
LNCRRSSAANFSPLCARTCRGGGHNQRRDLNVVYSIDPFDQV